MSRLQSPERDYDSAVASNGAKMERQSSAAPSDSNSVPLSPNSNAYTARNAMNPPRGSVGGIFSRLRADSNQNSLNSSGSSFSPRVPHNAASPTDPNKSIEQIQQDGLESVRTYMKSRTCYDVLPFSFRVLILDTNLLVKKALSILTQNRIVSATLWNCISSKFVGLLTSQDFINLIQYYYQNASFPEALQEIESLNLEGLREIEHRINAPIPETSEVGPHISVFEGCQRMTRSCARRIPVIDYDDDTGREMIVSVLTQFRILKFVAFNCPSIFKLNMPLKDLRLGTYENVATAGLETPIMDVIDLFFRRAISAVPVVAEDGVVLNMYESIDVISLIRTGSYTDLDLSVGEALLRRANNFEGVQTCTLNDTIAGLLEALRKHKIHRFVVVDEFKKLIGMISLSDILSYLVQEDRV